MFITKHIDDHYHSFLDLIYPRNCVVCKMALHNLEEHLCINCVLNLPVIDHNGVENEDFKSRFWGRISVKNCFAYLRYDKSMILKNILKEIKYNGNENLAIFMGNLMGAHYDSDNCKKCDLVIPIPLHPKKEKSRGFNQSAAIAKGFFESTDIQYSTQSVIRNKNTKTQTRMDRNERWENVKTIFALSNLNSIKNKNVLVLDDVVTTGATLESMAETLLDAGAESVSFAVLAIAI